MLLPRVGVNPLRRFALLCLAAVLAWLLAAAGASFGRTSLGRETMWLQLDKRCAAVARAALPAYPWPLAPFDRQHPVRGYFGDPRTVFSGRREAALSFHNGIDIAAWRGNRVFAVVSGRVVDIDGDRVIVSSPLDRRFQYIHIWPEVHVGEWVTASRSVLGVVLRRRGHLHLSEIRSGCVVNPLARGHLTPFNDTTQPQISGLYFEDLSRRRVSPSNLVGEVRVIAAAQDRPPLPTGQWHRMPVAPALLTWTLATLRGQVLLHGLGADFRYTEPPPSDFCAVYAPGTVQNFAAVAGVYRWARPGRFLFSLTPRPIDTSELHAGRYLFTVAAANLGGHLVSRRQTVVIRKRGLLTFRPAPPDRRCR